MGAMVNDLVLDTRGHCFLCEVGSSVSKSTYPLQYLSRYLKMDRRKVFSDAETLPPKLLRKVESAKLKVDLCKECATLNERFSYLYKQLEKTEMEILSCLNHFHDKLAGIVETGKCDDGDQKRIGHDSRGGLIGKQEIVRVLRTEVVEKCSLELNFAKPRVKVENWTRTKVKAAKRQLQLNSLSGNDMRTVVKVGLIGSLAGQANEHSLDVEMEDGTSGLIIKEEKTDVMPDNDPNNYSSDDNYQDFSSAISPSPENTSFPCDENYHRPKAARSSPVRKLPMESCFNPATGKHCCKLCLKEFATPTLFQVHFKGIHLKIRHPCDFCGKTFNYKASLRKHHRFFHMGIASRCEKCGKQYAENHQLMRHYRVTGCGTELP